MSASVTVSIGDETRGALREIFLVSWEVNFTSSAVKLMNPGRRMKSLESKQEEGINTFRRKMKFI